MKMLKISIIVGTRPQLLKAEFLQKALSAREEILSVSVFDTRQHYSECMTQGIVFPTVDLEEISKSDACIVIGDTDSTVSAAMIARQSGIPIIHLEAGLRCGDPFLREEQNRVFVDHMSDLLLCSSSSGMTNLSKEGFDMETVAFCGDILYDMTLESGIKPTAYKYGTLVTIHRRDTVDDRENLMNAIREIKKLAVDNIDLVLHPRTFKKIAEFDLLDELRGITLHAPLSHDAFLEKLCECSIFLTDSGGACREAFFLGQNFKVLRPHHEFEEDFKDIANFGDGTAAKTIADIIVRRYL